jgi:hypothetical protein
LARTDQIYRAGGDGDAKQPPRANRFATGVFRDPMVITRIANRPPINLGAVTACFIGQCHFTHLILLAKNLPKVSQTNPASAQDRDDLSPLAHGVPVY